MINEELIWEAERMLHQRCLYYKKREKQCRDAHTDYSQVAAVANAYASACDILTAAVENNKEILKEFDYYAD